MSMRKIDETDSLATSADLVSENLEKLKALFPELLTEGPGGVALNVDVLKALVGDKTVTDADEKYGLSWHGKRRARQRALTPSTGTLRPCPDESVDWDSTQNLLIEGDNLEVLKLLQKSYAGKVKLIYIDPPYNTGKDFVYPDNFQDSIRNYLELTGQVDGGQKVSSNTETGGRFHTDWLNMIYPRLRIAKNLLARDGVIFISIDDNEVQNIRAVADEIFGPENFVATIIWQKVYAPKSSAKHFSEDHDYVVVYARDGETWRPSLLARTEEQDSVYKNPDNDPRGLWRANNLAARNFYSKGTYQIKCPGGRVIPGPPNGSYWRYSEEKFWELDRDGRIWWGNDGNNVPAPKIFLSEVKAGRVPQTFWSYKEAGHNQEGKKELLELLPFSSSNDVFETPKPTRLIRRMLEVATVPEDGDVVMDFFAGSGTTAHAVMAQNAADGGNRRSISVQLNSRLESPAELTDGVRLNSLSDMTKERIRRASSKIRAENPMFSGDTGFRVFRLDHSNIRVWNPNPEKLEESLLSHQDHILEGRTELDVLYELLLKLGLDLCVPIQQHTVAGLEVHSIGGGVLMACLTAQITRDQVESLAQGIVDWHRKLAPAGETTCVFRDSAFTDDVTKSNLAAILEQHGIQNVRSL